MKLLRSQLLTLAASLAVAHAQEYLSFHSRPDLQPLKWIITKEPTAEYHDGYYLVCPWSTDVPQPAPAIYTSKGDLVWTDPEVGQCFNLDVQTLNGSDVLTVWNGTVNAFGRHGIGQAYIFDSTYEVTHVLTTTINNTSDLHEFTIPKTTNSTALLPVYLPVQADLSEYNGTEDGWVLYNLFQEIDIVTGEVLFQWNSSDHVPFSESYTNAANSTTAYYAWDYFRINSIDKDVSGNYLASSGHTRALYYINGTNGDIIWKLGGKNSSFTFGPNATFYGQQDARFVDGPAAISMHVGEATTGQTTERGLTLGLNFSSMEATVVAEFLPLKPDVSTSQGSLRYDPDGHVVFGGGTNPWISEYLPNGTIIYAAALGGEDLVDSLIENYRALKTTTWHGYPQTVPDVAFNGSSVWVSWNGATDVVSWEILTGSQPDVLVPAAHVRKDGFETEVAVPQAQYVRVQAYNAWGVVLGESHVYGANNTVAAVDGQFRKRSEIDGR
ncbi:ASST-domain-containing protein [Fomitopsis betulina]|nr:ASST-domain-containing protein [Fomitopsis betulina]